MFKLARRGKFLNLGNFVDEKYRKEFQALADQLNDFDIIYRALCAIMYNFVPTSGHPGGSISSGRIVEGLLFRTMKYAFSSPMAKDADILIYAAGHKALGLYTMWALRDEIARVANPLSLTSRCGDDKFRLRLEDLLGFRRNPTSDSRIFKMLGVKALDGHPTPATPFVRLATGASGVGLGAAFGMALAVKDRYRENTPFVHVLEGEGGLTPGRAQEAMSFASTAGLSNLTLHIDWNQSSIDSDRVCEENGEPGDYVPWNPVELAQFHNWNVIFVPNGMDLLQVLVAQEMVANFDNNQPTAIVYRTKKGWGYGIEGRASHGAGHKYCSPEFFEALQEFEKRFRTKFPQEHLGDPEENYWKFLYVVREVIENGAVNMRNCLAECLMKSASIYYERAAILKEKASKLGAMPVSMALATTSEELVYPIGSQVTLRQAFGDVIGDLNRGTKGRFFVAAADLLDSTSVSAATKGFPNGYYHTQKNPDSRTLAVGGICEDAMGAVMSGISAFGEHIGVSASYGAFIAPLQHIAARLHAIGQQARIRTFGGKMNPFFIVCGHMGLATGEDGPTHADPQALQLLQENFPQGFAGEDGDKTQNTMITLTPWCVQEMWPLVKAALTRRPAVIAVFVTRPAMEVLDLKKLGIDVSETVNGAYYLRCAKKEYGDMRRTIILQGSAETYEFVRHVLPVLDQKYAGYVDVVYISSVELLSYNAASQILSEKARRNAMGITGFTKPTLYRFVTSRYGRKMTLHPFKNGHFCGSGQPSAVLEEAGLDGPSQLEVVMKFMSANRRYQDD